MKGEEERKWGRRRNADRKHREMEIEGDEERGDEEERGKRGKKTI